MGQECFFAFALCYIFFAPFFNVASQYTQYSRLHRLNVTLEETLLSPKGLAPLYTSYYQRNYSSIVDEIWRLAVECSDIMSVISAQEFYKNRPNVNVDAEFFHCGDRRSEVIHPSNLQ